MSGRAKVPSQYYNPKEDSGAGIAFVVGLLVLVIVAIIFIVLYFTCTAPFSGSAKCQCTNSKGTWKTVDGKDVCACPATMDSYKGMCLGKCPDGKWRDGDGVCQSPLNIPPPNPNPNPNPTACTSTQELYGGMCVAKCTPDKVRMGGACVCPDGTESDTDGICKKSNIYHTNKYSWVLCPNGFSTAYNPSAYMNDTVCNVNSQKCDVCITTDSIYPTTYIRKGKTLSWPERPWDDPLAPGFDNTPTITGGRTMGYSGGTYITTAMPL